MEEVGLKVTPLKKLLTLPADTKVKTVSFWLVEVSGELKISLDPSEASEYGWYTAAEALNLTLYPGTRKFFEVLTLGTVVM